MHELMTGDILQYFDLKNVKDDSMSIEDSAFIVFVQSLRQHTKLSATEKLNIHLDCMNSLGQVITVDDVDDIGGAVGRLLCICCNR
jgi:hypothetical protein